MQERIKELIENHTIDELAQMVVDLEAELSVKENMKIVEDMMIEDEKTKKLESLSYMMEKSKREDGKIFEEIFFEMSQEYKEIKKLRKEIESLQKEVAEIKVRLSDSCTDKHPARPVKMTINEDDLSDMFDEMTKSRDRERSEMPWFYDIFNPRLFK